MKRLVLGIFLFTTLVFSNEVVWNQKSGDKKQYHIKCTNGSQSDVWKSYNNSYNPYSSCNGNGSCKSFTSLSLAKDHACSSKKTTKETITIKKGALLFRAETGDSSIKNALVSEGMFKWGYLDTKNSKSPRNILVQKIKYYKVKGTKVPNDSRSFIDNYYKAIDSHKNIFYVRENQTK